MRRAALGVQEESARASRDHVVDRARHLFARGPDDFGSDVGQRGIELCGERSVVGSEGPDRFRIAAVDSEVAERVDVFEVSVDVQVARDAGFFIEAAQSDGVVDAILRHVTISRPLAAGDCEQAGVVEVNGVVARE